MFKVIIDLQRKNSYQDERNVYANFKDSEQIEVMLSGIDGDIGGSR
jgi:hypothetical protein